MRRQFALALLPALLTATLLGVAPAAATPATSHAAIHATTADPAAQTTVYRFWSPQNQTHFYTTNVSERDQIISSYPTNIWTYEGPRFQAFSSQQPGTVALHRFWSPRLSGHFFTANENEKDSVIASYSRDIWTYEGVAYYVYPSDTVEPDSIPVARFWSPTNQHHFYTANDQEAQVVKQQYPAHIWTYEGINFRVPASIDLAIPETPAQYQTPVVSPPVVTPPVVAPPTNTSYQNCAAVRAAGRAPLYRGQPGYAPHLDRDGDGIACE